MIVGIVGVALTSTNIPDRLLSKLPFCNHKEVIHPTPATCSTQP